jgi:hypothetical protein
MALMSVLRFDSKTRKPGIAAASEKLLNEFAYIGGIEGAIERLKRRMNPASMCIR